MGEEEYRQKVGDTLKLLRLSKGMTQQEIAERFGFGKNTWCQYERGKRVPRDKTKRRIAEFAGMKVEELFYNEK